MSNIPQSGTNSGSFSLPSAFASLPSNIAAVLPTFSKDKSSFSSTSVSSSSSAQQEREEDIIETAKCYTIRHMLRKYGKLYVFPASLVFRSSALHVVDPLLGYDKLQWNFTDDIIGKPELLLDKPGFLVFVRRSGARGSVLSHLTVSASDDLDDIPDAESESEQGVTPVSGELGRSGTTSSMDTVTSEGLGPTTPSPVLKPAPLRVSTIGSSGNNTIGQSASPPRGILSARKRRSTDGQKRKAVFIFNSSEARNRCYAALLAQLGYRNDLDSAVSPQSRPSSPSGMSTGSGSTTGITGDIGGIRAVTPPPRDESDTETPVLKPLIRTSESSTTPTLATPATAASSASTNKEHGPALGNIISSSFSKIFSPSPKVSPTPPLNPGLSAPSIILTPTPKRITILTVGSRGDVQPFIALGKRLKEEGNRVAIATHPEFAKWIRSHGLKFRLVKGDPQMIMSVMVENGDSTYRFVKEANAKLRPWLTDLMMSGFEACQGSDVVLAGPSAIVGPHVAEALGLPFFFVMPMPWTRTKAFPHPFMTPNADLGGIYNELSYSLVDRAIYIALLITLNKWRKHVLGIPPTTLSGPVDPTTVPTLYCYSPSVLPKPADWPENIHVCGYWFLKNPDVGWTPPHDLVEFLRRRGPGDRVVYVGFGSIVVPDPKALTKTVVDAVKKSKVRVILSKGWSGRKKEGHESAGQDDEDDLPKDLIYQVHSIPHDWLFPQLDAVVHHGGAGTVAAGLREGKPTAICPWFGDQNFWSTRVEQLGVGVAVRKLNANNLSSALTTITTDADMQAAAEELGKKIRAEDGLGVAVESFWKELPRARKIIEDLREQHQYASDLELRDPTRSFMGDDALPDVDRDEWIVDVEEDAGPRRRSFRDQFFGPFRSSSPSPPPKSRTPSPTRTSNPFGRSSFEGANSLRPTLSPLSITVPSSGSALLMPQLRRPSKSSPALNILAGDSSVASTPVSDTYSAGPTPTTT